MDDNTVHLSTLVPRLTDSGGHTSVRTRFQYSKVETSSMEVGFHSRNVVLQWFLMMGIGESIVLCPFWHRYNYRLAVGIYTFHGLKTSLLIYFSRHVWMKVNHVSRLAHQSEKVAVIPAEHRAMKEKSVRSSLVKARYNWDRHDFFLHRFTILTICCFTPGADFLSMRSKIWRCYLSQGWW